MAKTGFFAYPSEPTASGEFIEIAISSINKKFAGVVSISSWKKMNIGGELIISNILKEIVDSDIFCADITNSNENVLFELGFAIGKKKPTWIIQDTSIQESYARFKELNFLNSVGCIPYTSSKDIVDAFVKEMAHDSKKLLIDQFTQGVESTTNKSALLYLKSQFDTDYNELITATIKAYKLPFILDDAKESKTLPLTWYISKLQIVPAVLVEFSSTFRSGFALQNAKCAFIAGLALGLGLKVQMVSEKPFPHSLDYQEYLKKFTNLELCKQAVDPFLKDLKMNIAELIVHKKEVVKASRIRSSIQKIRFGEYIAEHESEDIYDYYVNTTHEENILKSEYNIIIGRKGSGKTATFYYLQSLLNRDVRNQIISIKPINFEIDGLIVLLEGLNSEFEKGFIIESIWKLLLYTEVIKNIYQSIVDKPSYALEQIDSDIIEFVERHNNIILNDFSTRLEQALKSLEVDTNATEQGKFREYISEKLHSEVIGKLKQMIIAYMSKKTKLVILIDNLDKNWTKGKNIELTSKFIYGLLGVIGRIAKELKGNPKNPNKFGINLVIFLRSDIFKNILLYAREPDKIEYTRLRWNDHEILFRIVDTRLELLSDKDVQNSESFWEKLIVNRIDGIDVKTFILSCIIPRPRDIIYFLNCAKNKAVSRGHEIITKDDIFSAYSDYSSWVFQSVLVENGITMNQMEAFLYSTIGESSILTKDDIIKYMGNSNIPIDDDNVNYFIDFLCNLSFLGREVRTLEFEYEYDFENDAKIKVLAGKLNSNRFKIHNAFIPFLESKEYVQN